MMTANGRIVVALVALLSGNFISAQSNYASHANNIEYAGDGLPEEATLDGKVRSPYKQVNIRNIYRELSFHLRSQNWTTSAR